MRWAWSPALAACRNSPEETGLTRQALYKALSSDGNPEFATVLKVIRALGFRLHPEPASVD
jgi:probable addiction module antidote protein